MCVFCNLSNPSLQANPEVEPVTVFETSGWILGVSIWLFVLYQGYSRCKSIGVVMKNEQSLNS